MDDQDKDYLIAVTHVGELSLHVRQLESELTELRRPMKPASDANYENDMLWLTLSSLVCNCTDEADKQVEILVDDNNHDGDCNYLKARRSIKEAVNVQI